MADIENPALGIENDTLGDFLRPYSLLGQFWPIFGFFRFFLILAYFPYVFWGPKMTKYELFPTFSKMAGMGRKNVFWGVRRSLHICSSHFQTQNDHISWL